MTAWQTLQKAECATSDTKFRLLCGQCLAECNEYDQCLALLGDDDLQQILPDDSPGAEPRHARPPSGARVVSTSYRTGRCLPIAVGGGSD